MSDPMAHGAENGLPVHWIGDAPTSLHGNGAASFERTTRDERAVTCRLCLSLLNKREHLTNACACGDCFHPAFGPDTDGEPCEWCRDCACSVTEHPAWTDRMGDVWQYGIDGLMHTPETAPFPREHVERKWGPLRPTAPIPPAADWDTAFPPIRPHTCHIELDALYAGQRDRDCAGCRCIPPGTSDTSGQEGER